MTARRPPKAPLQGELKRLPMDRIDSKEQVRTQFPNLDELAQSILMEGLHTPITVEEADNGRYVILQGERRWRACKLAGLTEIDAIIRQPIYDKTARMLAQLTENIQREEMSSEDIANAVQGLMQRGMSPEAIGQALGKNPTWAYVYTSILDLPDEVKTIRDRYAINDPYILRPLKRMFELDKEASTTLIEKAEREHVRLTRENTQSFLNQIEKGRKAKRTERAETIEKAKPAKKESHWMFGCKPSNQIYVYCWVRLPGHDRLRLGRLATDRVAMDSEFVCVFVEGQYHIVSIMDVALAGVKDRSEPIDDLF